MNNLRNTYIYAQFSCFPTPASQQFSFIYSCVPPHMQTNIMNAPRFRRAHILFPEGKKGFLKYLIEDRYMCIHTHTSTTFRILILFTNLNNSMRNFWESLLENSVITWELSHVVGAHTFS